LAWARAPVKETEPLGLASLGAHVLGAVEAIPSVNAQASGGRNSLAVELPVRWVAVA
jgi:hypothetical protein